MIPPYFNPPWTLIPAVLEKSASEGVRGILVVPEWPNASWWPRCLALRCKFQVFTQPIFLSPTGTLRPKPRWNTVIAVVDGHRGDGSPT